MNNTVKKYKSSSGIETDIVLGTGDTGNQEQMKNWSSNIHWVREDIRNIKASFIKLGFHLYEIKRCNAYCIYGYDDFYEFCDNNFHLSSSTVRRHIQIYERFGEYRDGSIKMNIAKEYEGYTYSQLCEMLSLSDGDAKKIKPEMTVKEIREYKLSLKEEKLRRLSDHLDKLSKESDVDKAELKNKDCATSRKKCDAKKFQGTCVDCFYYKNSGCPYPEEHETVTEPEVCDVAQTEPEQEQHLGELASFVRRNLEALEILGYEIDNSVVRDAEYIKNCVEYIKESSDLFLKYIDLNEYGLAYNKCFDMLFALTNLNR